MKMTAKMTTDTDPRITYIMRGVVETYPVLGCHGQRWGPLVQECASEVGDYVWRVGEELTLSSGRYLIHCITDERPEGAVIIHTQLLRPKQQRKVPADHPPTRAWFPEDG